MDAILRNLIIAYILQYLGYFFLVAVLVSPLVFIGLGIWGMLHKREREPEPKTEPLAIDWDAILEEVQR